jgi:DNA polymerase III alpha subunit (gram-positive type)
LYPYIFYFDTETGGLDSAINPIVQIAWILENNGEIVYQAVHDVGPFSNACFSLEALQVNQFSLERLKAGKEPSYVLAALQTSIDTHCRGNLYRPCGHNINFDIDFLLKTAKRENVFLHDIDFSRSLDTVKILSWLDFLGKAPETPTTAYKLPRSLSLKEVCHYYCIPLNAHDAMSDITATRQLFHILCEQGKKST